MTGSQFSLKVAQCVHLRCRMSWKTNKPRSDSSEHSWHLFNHVFFFKIFYSEWAFKRCNKSEQIPAVTAVIPGCSSSCSLCWASPPPSLRRILRLGHTSCSPEHVCMKTSAPEHKITKWKKKLINAKWLVLWKDTFHLKHLKFTF